MGQKYSQITIEERCEISRLHSLGQTLRQIAASLDRAPSTIIRELKRNGSRTAGYQPSYAHQQARARRWAGSRLDRDSHLRAQVLSCLQQGWSPQQVSGRLAWETGRPVISHESIYRFIYSQLARKKDYSWRHYLPGPNPNGAGGGAKAAALLRSLPSAVPCQNVLKRPRTGALLAIGRRT